MDRISIIEQIRGNSKLLSIPQVLSQVLEEVGKEDFSPESLGKVILKDPNLTSRILKLVNSSFYHRMAKIKTVNQAISVLGVTTVKCLALSTSVFHPDKVAAESGVDPKAFFAYELAIAAAAEQIAKLKGARSSEEAFIAGLLQDIGILFFLHHYPKEYRQITSRKVDARSLIEAEQKVFGIDHTEVGGYLAEAWKLPDNLVQAIKMHHETTKNIAEDVELTNVVRMAVLLNSDHFSGFEDQIEHRLEAIHKVAAVLEITKEQIDEVSSSLLTRTISTAEFLGVDIGNIEEMLVKANQEIWKSYLTIENLFKERQELTKKLLAEEHAKGAEESKNIAMATLSHYLNNAVMAIYGRSQLLRMQYEKKDADKWIDKLPSNLDVVDRSVRKIVAVLEEMKTISPIDDNKFYSMSEALNIDDRIAARMSQMDQAVDITEVITNPSKG